MFHASRTIRTDICIAGAGIIGLSLALELQVRGLSVLVLEAGEPMGEASTAAAGMLAAKDPHNPVELSALSHLSLALYPEFLGRIGDLSGVDVPFQTSRTLQGVSPDGGMVPLSPVVLGRVALATCLDDATSPVAGFQLIHEQSIDPRQLAPALLAALAATSVVLLAGEAFLFTKTGPSCVAVSTRTQVIEAAHFVDCTGAWARDPACTAIPIKGQMLAVAIPEGLPLNLSLRTAEIYIVPRTSGPDAGRALIGATVEDVGFDKSVDAAQVGELHRKAAALLPAIAGAKVLESWAGLRPATADRLPLLGPHPAKPRHWIATVHYRNGILLAPATASIMADSILEMTPPPVNLEAFSPFTCVALPVRMMELRCL